MAPVPASVKFGVLTFTPVLPVTVTVFATVVVEAAWVPAVRLTVDPVDETLPLRVMLPRPAPAELLTRLIAPVLEIAELTVRLPPVVTVPVNVVPAVLEPVDRLPFEASKPMLPPAVKLVAVRAPATAVMLILPAPPEVTLLAVSAPV